LQTFASSEVYLRREARGLAANSPWPCDYGPDLSRGFRALKTWFTLKAFGSARLGKMIDKTCSLAKYLESLVEAEPDLELLAGAALNIVCFRYRGPNSNTLNTEIVADLQESGIVAPSLTSINGNIAIRAAIMNHRTEKQDIDALISATLDFGRRRHHG
jgi:glutamate/tyrosine decarboxylase-like PLP-dependent enzyme